MAVELTRGGYSTTAGRWPAGVSERSAMRRWLPRSSARSSRVRGRGHFVSGLHNLAGWLDPLRLLSPFWVAGSAPLQNGVRRWGVLVVVAAGSSPWLPARCWSTGATSSHSERSQRSLGSRRQRERPLGGAFLDLRGVSVAFVHFIEKAFGGFFLEPSL